MQLTSKKYISFKNIKNSECTHTFHICKKNYKKKKYVAFTHGSRRDGMATRIVIYV